MEIKITEENLRKAHAEGCSDVKRVLETLVPGLFKGTYPCLMKNMNTGLILLLNEEGSGWVVKQGNEHHPIGKYSGNWRMPSLTPIKGVEEIE